MRIVSSKRINFLVKNIFERYYEPIQEELSGSGLAEELAHKIKQEILATIYRRAMDEGIETEAELDEMAVAIINERLESVLVPYYVQKYVERFSLDKVVLENDMLNKKGICSEGQVEQQVIQETMEDNPGQGLREFSEDEIDRTENIENRHFDDFSDLEIVDLNNEREDTSIVRRMEEPRIRRFQINWRLTILVSFLVTLVLWFVVGMLMGKGYIPKVDFGYTWFNSHIWRIF